MRLHGVALLGIGLAALLLVQQVQGQPSLTRERGHGAMLTLTNSGLGVGGFWYRSLEEHTSALIQVSLSPERDERETRFFSGGGTLIPDKAHYLALLSIRTGLQQRLWASLIEDTFRPHVSVSVGPVLGWASPYFRDCDGDGRLNRATPCPSAEEAPPTFERTYTPGEALLRGYPVIGASLHIGAGAYYGTGSRTLGLHAGYVIHYLPAGVALLEPDARPPQRQFGSPKLTLSIGRHRVPSGN